MASASPNALVAILHGILHLVENSGYFAQNSPALQSLRKGVDAANAELQLLSKREPESVAIPDHGAAKLA